MWIIKSPDIWARLSESSLSKHFIEGKNRLNTPAFFLLQSMAFRQREMIGTNLETLKLLAWQTRGWIIKWEKYHRWNSSVSKDTEYTRFSHACALYANSSKVMLWVLQHFHAGHSLYNSKLSCSNIIFPIQEYYSILLLSWSPLLSTLTLHTSTGIHALS